MDRAFYRELLIYIRTKTGPSPTSGSSSRLSKPREMALEVSKECPLTAFLSLWLGRFVSHKRNLSLDLRHFIGHHRWHMESESHLHHRFWGISTTHLVHMIRIHIGLIFHLVSSQCIM